MKRAMERILYNGQRSLSLYLLPATTIPSNEEVIRFETTYNNQYFKFEVVGDKVGSICT